MSPVSGSQFNKESLLSSIESLVDEVKLVEAVCVAQTQAFKEICQRYIDSSAHTKKLAVFVARQMDCTEQEINKKLDCECPFKLSIPNFRGLGCFQSHTRAKRRKIDSDLFERVKRVFASEQESKKEELGEIAEDLKAQIKIYEAKCKENELLQKGYSEGIEHNAARVRYLSTLLMENAVDPDKIDISAIMQSFEGIKMSPPSKGKKEGAQPKWWSTGGVSGFTYFVQDHIKNYQCLKCGEAEEYTDFGEFSAHLYDQHRGEKVACWLCPSGNIKEYPLNQMMKFKKHLAFAHCIDDGQMTFPEIASLISCKLCSEKFDSVRALPDHKMHRERQTNRVVAKLFYCNVEGCPKKDPDSYRAALEHTIRHHYKPVEAS